MKRLFMLLMILVLFISCAKTKDHKIPETVFIKGGHFKMGDNSDSMADEYPAHFIHVKNFYLGKYEITNAQYHQFTVDNPDWRKSNIEKLIKKNLVDVDYLNHWDNDNYKPNMGNHPVVFVSYFAAVAYCKWLSQMAGKKFRLPSEGEWEYAASNGDKQNPYSIFPFKKENATFADNQGPGNSTRPVGSHSASPLGLYDMNGNVWEITMSLFNRYPYKPEQSDSMELKKHDERVVIRGGSFSTFLFYMRNTGRYFTHTKSSSEELGFRVAYSAE